MKWMLKRCTGDYSYTFQDICPTCGSSTQVPHPPRFSPEDKYVKFRLLQKGYRCP